MALASAAERMVSDWVTATRSAWFTKPSTSAHSGTCDDGVNPNLLAESSALVRDHAPKTVSQSSSWRLWFLRGWPKVGWAAVC